MNKIPQTSAAILLALALGPASAQAPPPAAAPENPQATQSQPTNERDTRREDMRREVAEAARAIGAYSQAERDQALQRAGSALDAMDRRIEQTRRGWVNDTERKSAKAREDRERLLAELRAQRADAAKQYRAMQEASAGNWERVKKQFVASYESLAQKLRHLWDSTDQAAPPGSPPEQPADTEDTGKHDN